MRGLPKSRYASLQDDGELQAQNIRDGDTVAQMGGGVGDGGGCGTENGSSERPTDTTATATTTTHTTAFTLKRSASSISDSSAAARCGGGGGDQNSDAAGGVVSGVAETKAMPAVTGGARQSEEGEGDGGGDEDVDVLGDGGEGDGEGGASIRCLTKQVHVGHAARLPFHCASKRLLFFRAWRAGGGRGEGALFFVDRSATD